MDTTLVLINIVVLIVLFASLFITVLDLPGNFVILIVTVAYGFYDNFIHIDMISLGVVCTGIVLGELFETLMGAIWAKREKASRMAIGIAVIGTILGGIVGTMVFPVVGSILGALFGGFFSSYVAEYHMTRDLAQAWRVAKSVFKGQLIGIVLKFSVALATIVYIILHMPWQS